MTTTLKTCFKCGVEKPRSEFYRHKQMADGLFGKCKDCTKRDVRQHRAENLEQYREYDRRRADLPHRVMLRRAYAMTEDCRRSHRKALQKQRLLHPEKAKARNTFSNAMRDGKVWKSPCCMAPGCYSTDRLHGHHVHYGHPLLVTWLCASCHILAHKQGRHAERQKKSVVAHTAPHQKYFAMP